MTLDQQILEQLCNLCGIATEYSDGWGRSHHIAPATISHLLSAMGVMNQPSADPRWLLEELEARPWRRLLPPVIVTRQASEPGSELAALAAPSIELSLPAASVESRFDWQLQWENGEQHQGYFYPQDLELLLERHLHQQAYRRYRFTLPVVPDLGYHQFTLTEVGASPQNASCTLIVTPARCYQPPILAEGHRVWGPTLQLYALRSQRNWGIGDFTDLRRALEVVAEMGASLLAVSPTHVPSHRDLINPYSPGNRLAWNVLHLDIEAVPDYAECTAAQEGVQDPEFQARLRALRSSDQVDYRGVVAAKLPVLEQLYQHFRALHLAIGDWRGRGFRDFQQYQSQGLRQQAVFEVLQEHFQQEAESPKGWRDWPEAYHDPNSSQVAQFADDHRERVEFYEYLQWQLVIQWEAVGRRSLDLGLGIGICQQLPLSVNGAGAESWAHPTLFASQVTVGSPASPLAPAGQRWDILPWNPWTLRDLAYAPFITLLRKNMSQGALHLEHVSGLLRQFWLVDGSPTSSPEGTYVSYPCEELLGILALESQRNRCMVIGDIFDPAPDTLSRELEERGILLGRSLYLEKASRGSGDFKAPQDYPPASVVALGNHHLPSLTSYWQAEDLRQQEALFPTREARNGRIVERAQDQVRLCLALEREALLPSSIDHYALPGIPLNGELKLAIHTYLARTPAQIMLVRLEDLLGDSVVVPLPNVCGQSGGWRQRLSIPLEEWSDQELLRALVEVLGQERGFPERQPIVTYPAPSNARIPNATYRLQFNSGFTFDQATRLVPYLQSLGISHCYASPYLKARPGSSHGYDIIDHNAINPEIGGQEGFELFQDTLRQHGMGQILDTVPNHMGVMGSDNAWWLDVLENGPASIHAPFFDIDWQPQKEGLRGKVLLPTLGNHYGVVLEQGELRLTFDKNEGSFSLYYYEHRFPIDPHEYPRLLRFRLEQLAMRLGDQNPDFLEYQSLVTAFSHLPQRVQTAPQRVAERHRDKEIHKKHLADLCTRCPDILWFLEETIQLFNGTPGDSTSFDLLHELLQNQAYWLAFWRVASDDINYRRFFDINDLAGLRMENPSVFEETHELVVKLLREGKLDGLRIDHPDGLYNPARYFQALQDCLVTVPTPSEAPSVSVKPLYVVVEKILETYERLPEQWPVHGTTGYDFANLVNALLVDGHSWLST